MESLFLFEWCSETPRKMVHLQKWLQILTSEKCTVLLKEWTTWLTFLWKHHNKSTPNWMSMLRQYVKEEIMTNFHNILMYFFCVISMSKTLTSYQRNFDGWKIDVVLTYFVRWNFDEDKICVISMYSFLPNVDGRKIDVASMYFLMRFWWKADANSRCWFWCGLERQRIVFVFVYLFDKLLYIFLKNWSCLNFTVEHNFVSMYFFQIISFHLEIY